MKLKSLVLLGLFCVLNVTANPLDLKSNEVIAQEELCNPSPCGYNAVCTTINHYPVCTCIVDHTGDPYVRCTSLNSFDVELEEDTTPSDGPCNPSPCGPNSRCKVVANNATCKCLPGLIGSPPNCKLECTKHSDCANPSLACMNLQCRDPCAYLCGLNAECSVTDHFPKCSCLAGYTGDPFLGCSNETVESTEDYPTLLSRNSIPDTEDACNPSPCGKHATCKEEDNNATCKCLPSYIGSPPNCRPECVVSSDCPSKLACINQHCRDPCPGACAPKAECAVINSAAVCSCLLGYSGDPYYGGCFKST